MIILAIIYFEMQYGNQIEEQQEKNNNKGKEDDILRIEKE